MANSEDGAEMRHAQPIPIFFASDDNYGPLIAICAYSILCNTDRHIDFYVLDGGISEKNKTQIARELCAFDNFTLRYIDMTPFDLGRFPAIRHYTVNMYARYFIPHITPELRKILYLDVDTIVKGDIAELYDQDLGEYPLGAVLEDFYPGNYSTLREKIYPGFQGGTAYFNSGVLLIDVRKFIAGDYCERLIDLTMQLSGRLACPDQDVLNIFFCGNFKQLAYRFNYMPTLAAELCKIHPKEGCRAGKDPLVIHYTAGKPWIDGCVARAEDFLDIVDRTGFSDLYSRKKDYLLPGNIKVFRVVRTRSKTVVKFFGLNLFVANRKGNAIRISLFGAIRILKIRSI